MEYKGYFVKELSYREADFIKPPTEAQRRKRRSGGWIPRATIVRNNQLVKDLSKDHPYQTEQLANQVALHIAKRWIDSQKPL